MQGAATLCAFVLAACASSAAAFAPAPLAAQRLGARRATICMGNNAAFGVFSPAVYAGKLLLGGKELNKIRGKGISLHSQVITEWCLFSGAMPLKGKLIKKAKNNGDWLGFLV